MTCIEALALAQTLIGFLTFLALVWYALETRKIRLDAAQQNDLLRRQVDLTQKMFGLEEVRETVAYEPDFLWHGGGSGPGLDSFRLAFKNGGAAVQQLSAEGETAEKFEITSSLDSGTEGHVDIRPSPKTMPVKFKIHYTTRRNERRTKCFSVQWGQNPKEIPTF